MRQVSLQNVRVSKFHTNGCFGSDGAELCRFLGEGLCATRDMIQSVTGLTSKVRARVERARNYMTKSPVARRIIKGTAWGILAAVISRGVGLVISMWVARIVGKAAFGELGIIQGTVLMFNTLSGFGLGLTATKHIGEFRLKDPLRAARIMHLSYFIGTATGLFGAGCLYLTSHWICVHILKAPTLTGLLKISSWIMIFSTVCGIQSGILYGLQKFRLLAYISIISAGLSIPVTLLCLYCNRTITGFVWSLVYTQLITMVIGALVIRRSGRFAPRHVALRGVFSEWRILVNYSLPALLTNMLIAPVNWVCSAILVNQPNGFSEMGTVNAIQQWRALFLFLPGVLAQVLLPTMSERLNNTQTPGRLRIVKQLFWANVAISLPMFLVLALCSRFILRRYGTEFEAAWPAFIIMQVAAVAQILQAPFIKVFESLNRMWANLALNAIWGGLAVILTVLFASAGALGVCAAQLVAFVVFGLMLWLYIRVHPFDPAASEQYGWAAVTRKPL